jgi:hypothetical protein
MSDFVNQKGKTQMPNDIFSDDELAASAATEAPVAVEAEIPAPEVQGEAAENEAAAVEAEAEVQVEGESKVPSGFVPHAALHAERQRVAELRARDAQREQRLQALEAMLKQPQQVEAAPSAAEDPVAALERIEKGFQDFTTQQQQAAEAQQINAYVQSDLAAFKARQPDFDDAVGYLVTSRVNELRLMGYSEDDIRQDINYYDQHVATTAARAGLSVGEMLYGLATQRGYRAAPASGANVTAISSAPTAAAKVAAIAKNQASERSLGSAAGVAPAGSLDLRAMLEMSDEEFAKIDQATFRRLAGG